MVSGREMVAGGKLQRWRREPRLWAVAIVVLALWTASNTGGVSSACRRDATSASRLRRCASSTRRKEESSALAVPPRVSSGAK
ncbi:uncharacterized protein M6B38_342375 [Iris pallida]|uniref:Uncharacterized protein n=1 Tax=Iris pallida TaxID=29817 RepID=A0AAX6GW19_IRIPA|nr:uncharacterized protein M6B38_342375 [Iris pallida]